MMKMFDFSFFQIILIELDISNYHGTWGPLCFMKEKNVDLSFKNHKSNNKDYSVTS